MKISTILDHKDAFMTMQEGLTTTTEKRVITKQWGKRQEQIERVMGAMVGMYGDLQAIARTILAEIEDLEPSALPSDGQEANDA